MATDPETLRLIAAAKKGDIRAFDSLVAKYERQVYNFACKLSRDPVEAFDIAQEAFIRVWNFLRTFRGEANFSTWLYRIVLNSYLDFRRRDKSAQNVSLEEYEAGWDEAGPREIADAAETLQELAERGETAELLKWALNQLPDYQRAMLAMFHFENKSYEEIAEIMDLPLGTVKSRLNRARRVLRELLSPHMELFGESVES